MFCLTLSQNCKVLQICPFIFFMSAVKTAFGLPDRDLSGTLQMFRGCAMFFKLTLFLCLFVPQQLKNSEYQMSNLVVGIGILCICIHLSCQDCPSKGKTMQKSDFGLLLCRRWGPDRRGSSTTRRSSERRPWSGLCFNLFFILLKGNFSYIWGYFWGLNLCFHCRIEIKSVFVFGRSSLAWHHLKL